MKRCTVCGEIVADDVEVCPVCGAKTFVPVEETDAPKFACEHHVGDGVVEDKEVMEGLRANFTGECTEVGMYLAMARVAEREGYPEVVTNSTKKNLELRVAAETGACEGKFALAKRAKQLGYDAIHDTVHEMAKDEARHGAGFAGLLKRYFNK